MTDPGCFDGYARDYDRVVGAAIGASGESVEFFARLKAYLARDALAARPPASLLDFGCGIGNSARMLAEAFPDTLVTGVDPSPESIEVARRCTPGEPPQVRFVVQSESRLPFSDKVFDAAFTANVFHHIPRADHRRWVDELRRVLRPGGTLLVFEHNPFNPLTRRSVRLCEFDKGVTLLRPGYTRRLLRAAGLVPGRARYYFFFPRALRALRPLERFISRVPFGAQYFVPALRER